MTAFVALGKKGLQRARRAAKSGEGRIALASIKLLAPFPRPAKNILQNRHRQWFLGKSLDGYCPMGPCIVTADEIKDAGQMHLVTRVNGEVRQDAMVSQLIFDIAALIKTFALLTPAG